MAGEILAIDQGTTGTKVLVVDGDGTVVAQVAEEFTQHYPRPGWVEHDPEEIWTATRGLATEALRAAGVSGDGLAGIGITNQRETTVVWDRDTGRPVHPAIVWQDRRTAPTCDRLKAAGVEPLVRRRTGLVIDAYFSATKIAWILDHVEGVRDRAARGEIAFGTVDSWLVWKLTGGRAHVTDYTNASRTMLYDIYGLAWDADLLEALDVPPDVLPDVRPSSAIFGDTDPEAFVAGGVPIAGIAGDQQAALFAQACYEEGLAKNTYGTGSFVLMNEGTNPEPIEVSADEAPSGPLATIAWGIADDPVEYALEGAIFVTGSAVQWLRDELQVIEQAGDTERLAAGLDGNDGVYFVPALTGLGAPVWDPYARGTIVGLTRGTTRAHLARATLEAIAYQTRDVVEAMHELSGVELTELHADGGATANRWLMQFQADVLGVPVVVPTISETTALGSAYLAGLATGVWKDRAELDALWTADRRFEPGMSREQADGLYGRWRDALDRALGWERDRE